MLKRKQADLVLLQTELEPLLKAEGLQHQKREKDFGGEEAVANAKQPAAAKGAAKGKPKPTPPGTRRGAAGGTKRG